MTCYPITRPVRTTEPTFDQEPVTLDEARAQCGLTGNTFHDNELNGWITDAREQVEHDTGLVCYTGAHTWKQTEFPCGEVFELPDIRPVTAVAIQYLDGNGDTQTWGSSNYSLETSAVSPFVRLAYGQTWPAVRGDINGITFTITAGYASVKVIPRKVKQAVLLALHIRWLQRMENSVEAEKQQAAYDRQVMLLRRGSYP